MLILTHREADATQHGFSCVEESSTPRLSLEQTRRSQHEEVGRQACRELEHDLLPEGLPDDMGAVVAKAFDESLHLYALPPSLGVGVVCALSLLGVGVLDALLPVLWASFLWAGAMGVVLGFLLPMGEVLLDQAWQRPENLPCLDPKSLELRVALSTFGALLLLALPLVLAFQISLSWFAVLAVPADALAILWLMTGRLAPVVPGFFLATPLARKEVAAILTGALLVAFGSIVVAFCLYLGPVYRMFTIPGIVWTWAFTLRLAGLLARRSFVRMQACQEV